MSDKKTNLSATDLPVALYLNQRLTFDLLAVLQGGFSSFSTVQTTTLGETTTSAHGKAQLGVSNVFALLGIDLAAGGSRQVGQKKDEKTSEELVHTPASLFAQLRKELTNRDLVQNLSSASHLTSIHPSNFVEFEATLRKNPLLDFLDTLLELLPLAEMFSSPSAESAQNPGQSRTRGQKTRKSARTNNQTDQLKGQIELMKSTIISVKSRDYIAELENLKVVLTTEDDYFIDPSMNYVIDGTFRVFGKVTRVISDNDEKISLLRNTAIGKVDTLTESLRPVIEEMRDSGFNLSTEIDVPGPTMQVIPIAIFS